MKKIHLWTIDDRLLTIVFCLLSLSLLPSCRKHFTHVVSVETQTIDVDANGNELDTNYLARLAPTKAVVDKEMNVKVGYIPDTLWVGSPECPLLDWLTDALFEAAKQLYDGPVDIAIVNMGSVRADWQPGDLTFGHIYNVMPFENTLVVITLTGADIIELCESFAEYGAQGIAGMRVKIIDGQLADVTIGGKPVNPKKTYNVATSNYLTTGADRMTALTKYSYYWDSEAPIRDLYIQAAKAQDTIRAAVDGRFMVEP